MIADRNRRPWRKARRTGGSGSFCVASWPGGTVSFQVFDGHRYVIATDDSGTSEINSTEGEAALNNNMVPDASETGHGDGEGRQQ